MKTIKTLLRHRINQAVGPPTPPKTRARQPKGTTQPLTPTARKIHTTPSAHWVARECEDLQDAMHQANHLEKIGYDVELTTQHDPAGFFTPIYTIIGRRPADDEETDEAEK